jgi:hypothetical protein
MTSIDNIYNNKLATIAIIFYIIRVILFFTATQHKKKDSKDTTVQSQAIAAGSFEVFILLIILYLNFDNKKKYLDKFNTLFSLLVIGILYAIRTGIFTYIATYKQPDCNDTSKYNTAELKTACETDNSEDKSMLSATITAGVLEALLVVAIARIIYVIKSTPNSTLHIEV